jgi:hypothetical protein
MEHADLWNRTIDVRAKSGFVHSVKIHTCRMGFISSLVSSSSSSSLLLSLSISESASTFEDGIGSRFFPFMLESLKTAT